MWMLCIWRSSDNILNTENSVILGKLQKSKNTCVYLSEDFFV